MYSHYKKLNILKTLVSLSYCFWRKKFRFVFYVVSLIFSNCSYNVHNYSQLFNYYLKNLIHISFKKNFNQKLGLQIFSEQLVYAFSHFIFLKSFVSFPKRYNLINKKCFFQNVRFKIGPSGYTFRLHQRTASWSRQGRWWRLARCWLNIYLFDIKLFKIASCSILAVQFHLQ